MIKMEVTRIHKLDDGAPTKAFIDIAIEDSFIIRGLRVIEGKQGLFISMPMQDGKDGKFYNTVLPLTRDVKNELEKICLEAYGDME